MSRHHSDNSSRLVQGVDGSLQFLGRAIKAKVSCQSFENVFAKAKVSSNNANLDRRKNKVALYPNIDLSPINIVIVTKEIGIIFYFHHLKKIHV